MSALITLSNVEKHHGSQQVLSSVSLSIDERERIGVIGPNGAGKSTLMRILVGQSEIDGGEIWKPKGIRVSYAPQTASFPPAKTVFELATEAATISESFPGESDRIARSALSRAGLDVFDAIGDQLSGGQRKRLQLALALCESPDLLILDEPTNHLDIDGIMGLESLLQRANFGWIVVSHDRWFLESAARRIIEVNKVYPTGVFDCDGSYVDYVERREEFLVSEQQRLSSLQNTVRYEQAWLRRGVKARTTKSKSRIDKAHALMESLSRVKARTRDAFSEDKGAAISFSSSERKTKRLLEITAASKRYGHKTIVENLDLILVGGEALGLLGLNGSGKTTLLQMIAGTLAPDAGTVKPAHGLSVAYFQQFDDKIDLSTPLKRVLSEGSDSVVFAGNSIHVASWAQRFRFSFEQLNQPYGSLSGGEKARARIAKLMLTTADLLLLDEPTNDLDIDTLEMLEQALLEFPGAVVLVTHDRFMINRICSRFLGLDGTGKVEFYADYEQWQRELKSKPEVVAEPSADSKEQILAEASAPARVVKKRLSYKDQREFDGMEAAIEAAEELAQDLTTKIANPTGLDAEEIRLLCADLDTAQKRVEQLYARWQELEAKQT